MGKGGGAAGRKPKKKCCLSKKRCRRCPIRMLKEGSLPAGYTVRKRKLVKDSSAVKSGKKSAKKSAKAA